MTRIFGNLWPTVTPQLEAEPAPVHVRRELTIEYPPILEQPDFKAANEKLAQFLSQKAELQSRLDQLCAKREAALKLAHQQDRGDMDIRQAEQILSGSHSQSETEQIEALNKDIEVLARAEDAQRKVLKSINDRLSHQAGEYFLAEHQASVARLAGAIQELHDAHRAEAVIRDDLIALGYQGQTLLCHGYDAAHDPSDNTGSPAYYWMRDTADYRQTPEQKATVTRKSRLAKISA